MENLSHFAGQSCRFFPVTLAIKQDMVRGVKYYNSWLGNFQESFLFRVRMG
jgi:hypothetical protein